MKPRSKKRPAAKKPAAKKRSPRVKWREAAITLARCVLFTLKFDKELGRGSGTMIDLKTGKTTPWQEQFFDALDGIGYVCDRKAYYQEKKHRRRSR